MRRSMSAVCAAILIAAALGPPARADDQKPNPLDNVPDKMPFDIPYGAPIALDQATALIEAAIAEAKRRDWKMNVAVVDSGANLVAFQRMDGAQIASVAIAEHKARAAAKFRRETKAFEAAVQGGNLAVLTVDDVMAVRGGLPLVVDGKLIGGIGCSGGTSSQDEVVCKAAIATLGAK